LRRLKRINVSTVFSDIVAVNLCRIQTLSCIKKQYSAKIISDNCNKLKTDNDSIQLIITSPPYAGAQKYIRSHSLSLVWLGLATDDTIRELKDKCIGKEEYRINEYRELIDTGLKSANKQLQQVHSNSPIRAHIAANYLVEIRKSIEEMYRVLKGGGFMVLVAGNNNICKTEFLTSEYLDNICCEIGFIKKLHLIDTIKSRGLMTSRNKTADIITRESVMVFKK
jgi:DNA modification methylase